MPPAKRKARTDPDARGVGEVLDALVDLGELLSTHVRAAAASIELSPPAALTLRLIGESSPMKELAERLKYDPSFVTAIADQLEERGYAVRETDRRDRRVKNLVATREGTAAAARFRRAIATDPPGIRTLDQTERDRFLGTIRAMIAAEREPEGISAK